MEDFFSNVSNEKTRLRRLSSEMQDATFEDPHHISFESTILFKDLPANFET